MRAREYQLQRKMLEYIQPEEDPLLLTANEVGELGRLFLKFKGTIPDDLYVFFVRDAVVRRIVTEKTRGRRAYMKWKMKHRAAVVGLLLLLGVAAPVVGQTTVPFPIDPTWRIAWDHDGLNTTGYRIVVDGIETDLGSLQPTIGTEYRTPVPALTPGAHIIVILSYNGSGVSRSANELQLIVSVAVPSPATNVRLIGPGK